MKAAATLRALRGLPPPPHRLLPPLDRIRPAADTADTADTAAGLLCFLNIVDVSQLPLRILLLFFFVTTATIITIIVVVVCVVVIVCVVVFLAASLGVAGVRGGGDEHLDKLPAGERPGEGLRAVQPRDGHPRGAHQQPRQGGRLQRLHDASR